MKHIERFSEAWNSSPSYKVTLVASTIEVLKSSLGKFWPAYFLAIIAILFFPALVFWNEIKLDPPLFVTEWLKLVIEGIIFFFVLEIVRHRSLSFTAHRYLINFVSVNYFIPIRGVVDSIRSFREALERHIPADASQNIKSARDKWDLVEHALTDDALSRLPTEGGIVSWLLKNRNELAPKRCGAILKSLATVQYRESLNQSELDELLSRLEVFLGSITSLFGDEVSVGDRS